MTHENERQMMEECNQFMAGSRKWHICNGTANGLTLAKQNQYRALWGLSQLAGEEVAVNADVPGNGVGLSVLAINPQARSPKAKIGGCCGGGRKTVIKDTKQNHPGFSDSSVMAHSLIQNGVSDSDNPGLSLWDKTKRLAEGAIGVTKSALGIDPASQETKAIRWAICEKCDKNDMGECVACGCWISPKISIKHSKCPLNLW